MYRLRATYPRHAVWMIIANRCLDAWNRFSISNTVCGCLIMILVLRQIKNKPYRGFTNILDYKPNIIKKFKKDTRLFGDQCDILKFYELISTYCGVKGYIYYRMSYNYVDQKWLIVVWLQWSVFSKMYFESNTIIDICCYYSLTFQFYNPRSCTADVQSTVLLPRRPLRRSVESNRAKCPDTNTYICLKIFRIDHGMRNQLSWYAVSRLSPYTSLVDWWLLRRNCLKFNMVIIQSNNILLHRY